ncbi:hypothetical protein IMX26_06565 [Clostridium sp. 'deep sea']|uniref:hypothetical protein n=1 Tax=Clostridium sp. 'deep sea' TaxID=2779445 RepID=UPI0018964E2F|nr:hypothetical protein [Clostridium sp. 'deep sea']QOR36468.1 hypothetical protein IMX26_06565 [Clostridium sp. 'deep sea']
MKNIQNILINNFETKIISSGENYPKININNNNLKSLCILLHCRISLAEIKDYFGWDDIKLFNRIRLLLNEDLIIKVKDTYVPNFMIITLNEGKQLYNQLLNIDIEVADLIISSLSEIKQQALSLKCFKQFNFEDISLLVLSNIILDAVQIDYVESLFLSSKRTIRNTMNYYYSIQEKDPSSEVEAFRIYGNMIKSYGTVELGVYGNKRNGINFHNLNQSQLTKWFNINNHRDVLSNKSYLLEQLLKYYSYNTYEISEQNINGFNKLGIMNDKSISIPILSQQQFTLWYDIAKIITADLIKILNKNKAMIYNNYSKSVYVNEISFNEYFIWWYHLLYSKITDILVEKRVVKIPKEGVASYIVY